MPPAQAHVQEKLTFLVKKTDNIHLGIQSQIEIIHVLEKLL